MDSLLMNFSRQLNDVFLLALVLAALAAAVVLLLASLAARRAWQHFRTKQFDALSFKIHERWPKWFAEKFLRRSGAVILYNAKSCNRS